MAKSKRKTSTTTKPAEKPQEQPSKPEEHVRQSFIPGKDEPPAPVRSETDAIPAPGGEESSEPLGKVVLEIARGTDRNVTVSLTIPPLKACKENVFLPLKASAEQIASITAGAVQRAAASAEADGIFQHAQRQREEAEAKEQLARR